MGRPNLRSRLRSLIEGYDVVVLDGAGREWIAFDELRPGEWLAVWDASRLRSLPMLMILPDFYGDERTFSPAEVHSLVGELDILDADPTLSPGLARASKKLRSVARSAIDLASPLIVLPG